MRDSAMKRIFWLVIFGSLVAALMYGSFVWSLGQTVQFTSLLVPDSRAGGIIFGVFVQFAPTAFLYLASSFSSNKPDEQNQRLWWIAAFWGVSIFDGLTNLGARFDDISTIGLPNIGFENPEFAIVAQWMMIIMGVILDFAIVFAEELLGNFISVFMDNLAALITLLGGNPPKWFAMVSGVGRAVGGRTPSPIVGNRNTNRNNGKGNRNKGKGNRPSGPGSIDRGRTSRISSNPNRSQRPSSDIPVNNRGQSRDNITIFDLEE